VTVAIEEMTHWGESQRSGLGKLGSKLKANVECSRGRGYKLEWNVTEVANKENLGEDNSFVRHKVQGRMSYGKRAWPSKDPTIQP